MGSATRLKERLSRAVEADRELLLMDEEDIEELVEEEKESGGHADGLIAMEETRQLWDLEDEVKHLREEVAIANAALDEMCRLRIEERQKLKARYDGRSVEYYKLYELWREHLDATDYDLDDDYEREARQLLWEGSDTEKQIHSEGYDES
jgi:hypothetical protein